MGPDCKSGGNAFTGSNPVAPTRITAWMRPRSGSRLHSVFSAGMLKKDYEEEVLDRLPGRSKIAGVAQW